MSLKDWLKSGWLVEHRATGQEIADLLRLVERDLSDCQAPRLSPDWQLNIAYNAALQAATAALAASGYRAGRESHHFRTIQSLAFTIGADAELVALLNKFRKKRNISDYERAGSTSEQEAKEMLILAQTLYRKVEEWLYSNYPELFRK